jgi:hypothetical protein
VNRGNESIVRMIDSRLLGFFPENNWLVYGRADGQASNQSQQQRSAAAATTTNMQEPRAKRISTDLTMATCPTTFFSTTSAPTTSKPMSTTARASTNTSRDDYVDEAGRNTSTLVGGATTNPPVQQTMNQTTLQTSLKRSTESASSSDSNSSAASTSSKSVNTRNKKKHKSPRPPLEPTEQHMEIRAVVDAAS